MMIKALRASFFTTVIVAFCTVLYASPGRSQEKHGAHGEGHDTMHHWYQTLKQPLTGMSCCNNEDCRPTVSRVVGETVEVMVDGEWTAVPHEKIVKTPSPDLGSHVCAPKYSTSKPKTLFCVVLGGGV
jgi:hypothetical protein